MWGLKRAGAGIALVAVILAGCGGDGDDPGASGAEPDAQTSAAIATPSEATSSEAADAFCADMEAIEGRLQNLEGLTDTADPEAALTTIEDSVDALRSVEPPAEIAEDWSIVVDAFDGLATSLRNLNTSDPATLDQELEDLVDQMEQQSAAIDESGTRIDQYLSDECGMVIE